MALLLPTPFEIILKSFLKDLFIYMGEEGRGQTENPQADSLRS